MDKREFIKTIGIGSLLAGGGMLNPTGLKAEVQNKPHKIKPERLRSNDYVGVIAPASFVTEKDISETIENLVNLGLKPVIARNLFKKRGYLAGTDEERAADIHEMFSRKDIKGIVCARGGFGTPRILRLLDYELIRKNPKVIIGYSDITALLNAINIKTGLVTFHGPVGISTFNEFSLKYLYKTIFEPQENLELISESGDDDKNTSTAESSMTDITIINEGKSEGILAGGNLSLIVSMIGTGYDFEIADKIIFIEEIGEEPYRMDRMLNQLMLQHGAEKCKGIVFGICKNCETKVQNPAYENSLTLKEVLTDNFSRFSFPVIYGLSFGHIKNKFTLPIGIKAGMDTSTRSITLLETAVE